MGTRFEFVSESDLDSRLDIIAQALSLEQWQHGNAEESHAVGWTELLEKLGSLFEFFARAQNPRGMAMRVWCVLYAVRPDLIDNETIQTAADRFEVSQQRVCEVLETMKRQTGITYRSKVGVTDMDTQRMRIDAMSRARSEKAARFAMREVATS